MSETVPSPGAPRLKLRLSPAAETAVRSGHPWVFDQSVREQNREGMAGEIAIIYDRRDTFLALGFYDPASPIRVRILHIGKPATLDAAWWKNRLDAALQRRQGLFEQAGPSRATDGCRLINGESDGWPGLVLDRYAGTLVLKVYAAAWLPRLGEVVPMLRQSLPWATALVLRLSRNLVDIAQRDHQRTEGFLFSENDPPQETVVFRENGLRFEADVRHGQKTGFFLDQRENRARVEALAAGRHMLNAFSFSGGFSLYAARGGARSVTDVDLSEHALASARRNFALNHAEFPAIAACPHLTVQADAFAWLARPARESFDLIVVDPPSLARRESERAGAIEAYARLHASALARLRPGGVLVAASCSAHVDEEEFFSAVRRTVRDAGRPFRELWTSDHAPDHPATFKEARYLKCLALRCEP
jgi:23S rRNA (cytosine1962-C5)-methyltransferase